MGQRYRKVVSYLVNIEVDSFPKGNTPITLNFNTVFQPKSLRGFCALTTLFAFEKCPSPLSTPFTQTNKPSAPDVLRTHLGNPKRGFPAKLFLLHSPSFSMWAKAGCILTLTSVK